MNKFHWLVSFILLIGLQSCAPKWDPRKYRSVSIIDSEWIYSTYDLNKKEHEKEKNILMKKRELPDSVYKKITSGYQENRWPPALQTPQSRYENRRKLKNYKAYIITEFRNKYILYVPNKENKAAANLSPEMMSDKDFYMIVKKNMVEKHDEFMKGYENWTRPPKPKKVETTPPSRDSKTPVKSEKDKTTPPVSEKDKKKADEKAKKEAAAKDKAAQKAKDEAISKQLEVKKGKNKKETKKRIKSEKKKRRK